MSFFNRSPNRKRVRNGQPSRRTLSYESLEGRQMMAGLTTGITLNKPFTAATLVQSGTAVVVPPVAKVHGVLDNGVLRVEGTSAADTITVLETPTQVWLSGARIYTGGGVYDVVPLSWVNKVEVYGYAGGDQIDVTFLRLPTEVWGGDGIDWLMGGMGPDILHGGKSNDQIHGNDGEDTIFGDDGADSIWGEAMADVIHGGRGADKIWGGTGVDRIFGDEDNDFLWGDDENDFLFGGDGTNDQLKGGRGDDWLEAGFIWELADGEEGDDWNAHAWAIDGATYSDINQGRTGDCAFLSVLAAASRHEDLASRITYEGDFTYAVWLYDSGVGDWVQEYVWFDGSMIQSEEFVYDPTPEVEGEFWTIIYHRAYMTRFHGAVTWCDYEAFDGETAINPALIVTGEEADWWALSQGLTPENLLELVNTRTIVTTGDGEHAYAVFYVSQDEYGEWWVGLYNPWGKDETHKESMPFRSSGMSNDGLIQVHWNVFVTAVEHIFYT